MNFITEGAAAVIALRFLVAAAVDKPAASCGVLIGLLATLKVHFLMLWLLLALNFQRNFLIPQLQS